MSEGSSGGPGPLRLQGGSAVRDQYQELSSQAIVLFGSRRYAEAAEKFEQALAIPSDAEDRVAVEWTAGVTYTHFIQPNTPLSLLVKERYFRRAVELMEGAIALDLARRGGYFHEPGNWRRTNQLDNLYASMADVLEDEQSDAAALAYLSQRTHVIQAGAMLESMARIGQYHARAGDTAKALEWYQLAAALPPISGDPHEQRTRGFVQQELNRLTKKGGCFIATAAYGAPNIAAVAILRVFRDRYLRSSRVGRLCVGFYYLVSPPLARLITRSSLAQRIVRALLSPLVWFARVACKNAG